MHVIGWADSDIPLERWAKKVDSNHTGNHLVLTKDHSTNCDSSHLRITSQEESHDALMNLTQSSKGVCLGVFAFSLLFYLWFVAGHCCVCLSAPMKSCAWTSNKQSFLLPVRQPILVNKSATVRGQTLPPKISRYVQTVSKIQDGKSRHNLTTSHDHRSSSPTQLLIRHIKSTFKLRAI